MENVMMNDSYVISRLEEIRTFQPNLATLEQDYREWHVESLLNQAADLIDKCIDEFREFCTLDYSWKQLFISIYAEEKELTAERDYYKNSTSGPARALEDIKKKEEFFNSSETSFNSALEQAQKLFDEYTNNNPKDVGEWIKSEQNFKEKQVESFARILDIDLNALQKVRAGRDEDYLNIKIDNRFDILTEKRKLLEPLFNQRSQVLDKLKPNYEAAINRMAVVQKGLLKYYNKNTDTLPNSTITAPADHFITDAAIWIRKSIEFVVRYQQNEQGFTRIISLKTLLAKDNKWNDLENKSISFKLPANFFDSHENVRLRGISASIVGQAGFIPWSMSVNLPIDGLFLRNSENYSFTQKLPTCLIGRVENVKSSRPIEICGLTTLLNASPIGQETQEGNWIISLNGPVNNSESFSQIEDLLLEIRVVGLPK